MNNEYPNFSKQLQLKCAKLIWHVLRFQISNKTLSFDPWFFIVKAYNYAKNKNKQTNKQTEKEPSKAQLRNLRDMVIGECIYYSVFFLIFRREHIKLYYIPNSMKIKVLPLC